MEIWPGNAYPLGATFDGSGTNFALFSEGAERVELCLFDEDGTETRVDLGDLEPGLGHLAAGADLEEAELDALGDLAEEGEVGAAAVEGGTERVGRSWPDLHGTPW